MPNLENFERPVGDELVAGVIVIGAVVLLVIIAHVFKDVAPS